MRIKVKDMLLINHNSIDLTGLRTLESKKRIVDTWMDGSFSSATVATAIATPQSRNWTFLLWAIKAILLTVLTIPNTVLTENGLFRGPYDNTL